MLYMVVEHYRNGDPVPVYRRLLDEWLARWADLVEFEVYAVISSELALSQVSSRL